MNKEIDKEYEASLKSIETENVIDRLFYRPIGFQIARMLKGTGITPNMVTIISIFVGASVGYLFYQGETRYTLYGIAMLIFANILDCVDGQLARLTGIKSKIGRILDGIAGDIWFTCIYVMLALKLSHQYGTYWFFALAVASGFSHLVQANITDYYKTLHLFFISKEKGAEFQSFEQVRQQQQAMNFGINKCFYFLYRFYTLLQVKATPSLQAMLNGLQARYGEDIPEEIRLDFRKQSSQLMKRWIDLLTFNGRTLVLFLVVLLTESWVYFLYEIFVLNTVLCISMRKHERMCATFINR